MDLTIRQATVNDAQGVVDVINSTIEEGGKTAFYPPLTAEQGKAFIQGLDTRSALFIVEMSDAILGVQTIEPFAAYTHAMNHVGTLNTFVYKNFRGKGVGHTLMEKTLQFAREQGYEKLIIYVRIGNSDAQAFYRAAGFLPKMMLERQIKIDGKYDDLVLMEMFLPTEKAAAAKPAVPEPAVAEPAVSEPPVAEPQPAKPVVERAVDPAVGAITVRRAKRKDVRTLAAIMKGSMNWRPPPSQDQVLEMLFDKGYWLAMSRKGGGLTGWRAENLVMCIDDFFVYPPQYYPQVGEPLLETVESEAKALSCEVAIVFLDQKIAPEAIEFFAAQGYEKKELDELFKVWQEVAREFLTDNQFMMVKKLLEKRIMRPL